MLNSDIGDACHPFYGDVFCDVKQHFSILVSQSLSKKSRVRERCNIVKSPKLCRTEILKDILNGINFNTDMFIFHL